MVIDISTVNPPNPGLFCFSHLAGRTKGFRRNFFISVIACYLLASLSLLIFAIPHNLKGLIGIAMVIGLCALLIVFVESDRIAQASSAAAALMTTAELRHQDQLRSGKRTSSNEHQATNS